MRFGDVRLSGGIRMSCSVFVHIKHTEELEKKIKDIKGIVVKGAVVAHCGDSDRAYVPEELFSQHKKEDDAHKWIINEGVCFRFPENSGKWEYKSHGFDIWFDFNGDGGEREIVFIVPCHWNPDHGIQTISDLKDG